MIYQSFDLETTCIDPKAPQNVLGLASVLEDTTKPEIPLKDLPHFVGVVDPGKNISGSPYALKLNRWILDGIDEATEEGRSFIYSKDKSRKYPIYLNPRFCEYDWRTIKKRYNPGFYVSEQTLDIWHNYRTWLAKHYDLVRDRINIAGKNVAGFDMCFLPKDIDRLFRHRVIDAGSVLVDWSERCIDSLGQLKTKRLGGGEVSHDMLEDAWDVIELLRTSYPKKP